MPVNVRFVDGTERAYADASSAALDGPVFRVRKWNPARRKFEDVDALPADSVTLAEVLSAHGEPKEIIAGRGRAKSG
jgi:hypothetical protein